VEFIQHFVSFYDFQPNGEVDNDEEEFKYSRWQVQAILRKNNH